MNQKIPCLLVFTFQIVYTGIMLPSAIGLMETSFVFLLFGIAVSFIIKKKPFGWIFFAFAIFTRYEIAVYVVIFALIWLITCKSWRERLMGFFYFIIPFLLISLVVFGFYSTLIPNTLSAKQVVYQMPMYLTAMNVLVSIFPVKTPFLFLAALLLIVITVLSIPKKVLINVQNHIWSAALILGGVLVALSYIFLKILVFTWYIPIFLVPIGFGMNCLIIEMLKFGSIHKTEEPVQRDVLHSPIWIILLTLFFSYYRIGTLSLFTYSAVFGSLKIPFIEDGIRVQRYLEVGKELYTLFPNARLLTSEIGGLGYSFRGEIIDAVGLVTPSALTYHPMKVPQQRQNATIGAIPARMVGDLLPELVVSLPIFVQEFDHSSYRNLYTKIIIPSSTKIWRERTGTDLIWGSSEFYIYVRNDLASQQKINEIVNFPWD